MKISSDWSNQVDPMPLKCLCFHLINHIDHRVKFLGTMRTHTTSMVNPVGRSKMCSGSDTTIWGTRYAMLAQNKYFTMFNQDNMRVGDHSSLPLDARDRKRVGAARSNVVHFDGGSRRMSSCLDTSNMTVRLVHSPCVHHWYRNNITTSSPHYPCVWGRENRMSVC
jgi:hypothetical protein